MTAIQGCNFCSRRGSVSAVNAHLRNYITSAKELRNAKFADNHPLSIMQAFAHRSKPDRDFADDTSSARLAVLLSFAEMTSTPLPTPAAIAAWGLRQFHTRTSSWWDRQVRLVTIAYLNHDCDDALLERLVRSVVDDATEASLAAAVAEPPDAQNTLLKRYANQVATLNSRRAPDATSNRNILTTGSGQRDMTTTGRTIGKVGGVQAQFVDISRKDKERIREFYSPTTSRSEVDEDDGDDDDDANTFRYTPGASTRQKVPKAVVRPGAVRTGSNHRYRTGPRARRGAPAAVVRKRTLMPSDDEEDDDGDLYSAHSTVFVPPSLAPRRRPVSPGPATAVPLTATGHKSFDPKDVFLVLSVRGLTGRFVDIPIPFLTSLQGAVDMALAQEPEVVRRAGLDLGFEGDEEAGKWAGKWDDYTWRRLREWAVDTDGVVKVRVVVL